MRRVFSTPTKMTPAAVYKTVQSLNGDKQWHFKCAIEFTL